MLFSLLACSPSTSQASLSSLRNGDIIEIAGAALPRLQGTPITALSAWACGRDEQPCARIVLQVDERDAGYRWALDEGPRPLADDPAGVLDDNDILLLQAADSGALDAVDRLPPHETRYRLTIRDPLDGGVGFLFILSGAQLPALRAAPAVAYDAPSETFTGRRLQLGFAAGIPQSLVLTTGPAAPLSILDRFKIRASASLLWGLWRFSRHEGDLTTEIVGWRRGPVRIIRSQEQRVRLGWGIRSPRFSSYAFFHPDFAELPVSLRLNHPPAALFGDIRIDVVLDFFDLSGWQLLLPGQAPRPVGRGEAAMLSGSDIDWFALRGADVTLLLLLDVGPSLQTTRRTLLYRETAAPQPPEEKRGEWPGIGYRIDRWEQVEAGTHHLRARCFALPADIDASAFVAAQRQPLIVDVGDDADLSSR